MHSATDVPIHECPGPFDPGRESDAECAARRRFEARYSTRATPPLRGSDAAEMWRLPFGPRSMETIWTAL